MRQFDYSYLANRTWDNEIISYISKIHALDISIMEYTKQERQYANMECGMPKRK